MLTFVCVLVLAVIGTQAAPQFQPADAAQQPNVPSVTILTQTDAIGADGSFNNRFGHRCYEFPFILFVSKTKCFRWIVLKPRTVSSSRTVVSSRKFWFQKHVKMVHQQANKLKATFSYKQDLTHLQVIVIGIQLNSRGNSLIKFRFEIRWGWCCLHNYLHCRRKWFPTTRWTYSHSTCNSRRNFGLAETVCTRSSAAECRCPNASCLI